MLISCSERASASELDMIDAIDVRTCDLGVMVSGHDHSQKSSVINEQIMNSFASAILGLGALLQ